ncbi:MAG: tRNA (N(6)-L-threonylcarbamoyladenosine(37)-C(2))-methylthiotransferase MtaB [Candidatus Omnitrophica bacterium]|nr:tRNA (N(6)-L-threonylcarbamoyladenosine(37)-C(2))-methylthiotransferase MtaB [Candidatus Omnitrophota bacterium]
MNSIAEKKRFYIHTLGCKVNQYESQAMREILIKAGFNDSGSREDADIYVLNTCTVTAEADKESKRLVGQFHRANADAMIVVTGCLAERNAPDLAALPGVTHVVGNAQKGSIARIIAGKKIPEKGKDLRISGFKGHSKAYVKIQDGCENKCSYCKVRLVRGRCKSKPIDDIVEEVQGLVCNGFREIILTGICLGAWGKDFMNGAAGLIDVFKALTGLGGGFRVRLSSIEPKYVTDGLIEFMAGSGMVCPHLHIPFQSGDDDILKLMNRPYTSSGYAAIVDKVRDRIPDIAITTDMIIGFPGESEERFKRSIDFIKRISPSRTHIFTFSRREGTSAHDLPGSVNGAALKERYKEMCAVTDEAADIYRRSFLSRKLDVLVEERADAATGLLRGYSDNYIYMHFTGRDDLIHGIIPVRVAGFNGDRTVGEIAC